MMLPNFGDFYFDVDLQDSSVPVGKNASLGPRYASVELARDFWNSSRVEETLGYPDVIHSNNFWCPETPLNNARLVYTLYDVGFTLEPSWTTESNRVGCFEGIFRASIVADWIIAISHESKSHFLTLFPHFSPDRVRVIHPCSRYAHPLPAGSRPKTLFGVGEGEFWLSVGTIEPRKNQRRLVEAFSRYLAGGGSTTKLVLAGGAGWLMEDFSREINEMGVADHVILTGYVSDEELAWLYRNCYANLYPSLFEGFGLPVLEGMQFGAATLASSTSSIPEVGGDAAILLPPDDVMAWRDAMLLLDREPARLRVLRASAERQASKFDPKSRARMLRAMYEDAITT
jgi:glycosyltransferase involved in cell wall biosynthesis